LGSVREYLTVATPTRS